VAALFGSAAACVDQSRRGFYPALQ